MRESRWSNLAQQVLVEDSDAELLGRYVRYREEDAFSQLVARYSRLVWVQCRNLLPDADADDAFQATFLTLAQAAGKLPAGIPLGPWLHGVAYRVCQNARRAIVRRTQRERAVARPEAGRPVADSAWEAAFAAVAEEVQGLAAGQRTAFVLCCIEGRTTAEAAEVLGVNPGALATRLSRAKQALLDRLARRGLGAGVLALSWLTGGGGAAPAALVSRTLSLVAAGVAVPGSVQSLTHGVIGMTITRFKLLAVAVLLVTGLGLGIGGWFGAMAAQPPGALPPASKSDLSKGDPPAREATGVKKPAVRRILTIADKEQNASFWQLAHQTKGEFVCLVVTPDKVNLVDGKTVVDVALDPRKPNENSARNIREFEVVCLLDVEDPRIKPNGLNSLWDMLRPYVEAGGKLVILPGPKVSREGYAAGGNLMPGTFKELLDTSTMQQPPPKQTAPGWEQPLEGVNGVTWYLSDAAIQHPMLKPFQGWKAKGNVDVVKNPRRVKKYWEAAKTDGSSVVVYYNDAADPAKRHAAILERGIPDPKDNKKSRGRVLLLTTRMDGDLDWHDYWDMAGSSWYVVFPWLVVDYLVGETATAQPPGAVPPASNSAPSKGDPTASGATVSGRILTEPNGKPVAGEVVKLYRGGEPWATTTTKTDDKGNYTFKGVKPGGYKVGLVYSEPHLWSEWGLVPPVTDKPVTADDLFRTQPQSVSGKVTDVETGEPVAKARINFSTADHNRDSIVTNEKGEFRLYVVAREVDLYCDGTKDRYEESEQRHKLIVTEGKEAKGIDFKVRGSPKFTGLVVDDQGRPVKGADVLVEMRRVTLRPPGGYSEIGFSARDTSLKTDNEGRFSAYMSIAYPRGGAKTIRFTVLARTADQSLGGFVEAKADMESGFALDPLKITLQKTGSVKFRLLNPDGEPLEKAEAIVSSYRGWFPQWGLPGTMKPHGKGRFEAAGLIPGVEHYIVARADGYQLSPREFKAVLLKSDETADAGDITLDWWGKKAVPGLLKKLQSANMYDRDLAIGQLGELGTDAAEAVPALVEKLKQDPVNTVRFSVANTLGKIGPAAKAAVPDLIKALQEDTGGGVQREAATALGLIGDASALAALKDALTNSDNEVPRAAAEAIKRLGK